MTGSDSRSRIVGRAVVGLVTMLASLTAAASARAQVACTAPDVLCTGDPCVTSAVEVLSPCVLDFGRRALVVAGRLRVSEGGTLTLTAGPVDLQGTIDGRGVDGAHVTVVAAGTITQRGHIDTSGSATAGSITLQAGGDVTLTGKMKSAARFGSDAAGGSITVESGGRIIGPGTFGNDVRGGSRAPAGQAIYRGAAGVELIGHLHIWGDSGGYAEFVSTAGKVTIGTDVRTRVRTGAGGMLILSAATDVIVARGLNADGAAAGGRIIVSGNTVTLPVHEGLHARGRLGAGGVVLVNGGVITAKEAVMADGLTSGGTIAIDGDVVTLDAAVSARGGSEGGRIMIVARSGDISQTGTVDASGGGGVITSEAPEGTLLARGSYRVAPAGCITLSAGDTLDTADARFDTPPATSCP